MNSASKTPFYRKKISLFLLSLLSISGAFYFFRESEFVKNIQGQLQRTISHNKSVIYSLGKNENKKISELETEVAELNQKIVDYELVLRDNEALRSQFENSGEQTFALSNAKILGFTGDNNLPDTLVINVGEKEGIKNGMAVIFKNYLIGEISKVSKNFSVVTTVLNPDFQTLAKVPSTNANGIIFGSRDFMLLDRVVITDKLEDNTNIVTRGEANTEGIGIFPDLIIGKITSISKNESSPFQSAQVSPVIDFSRLTNVFVIVSL